MWCGTDAGVVSIAADGIVELGDTDKLRGWEITGLMCDKAGELWIGTRNGWLYRQSTAGLIPCGVFPEMRGYSISGPIQARDETVWFGSQYGRGLGSVRDGEYRYYHPEQGDDCPLWVGAIAEDAEGAIWIGSASPNTWDGLCRYRCGEFERVAGCSGTAILALCVDQRGRLWVGTNEGALCLDSQYVLAFTNDDGLPCEIVTAVTEGSDGKMWFGTEGGGICCYDGKVFQSVELADDPILNVVHDILEDAEGVVWYCTNAGVVRYAPRAAEVTVEVSQVVAHVTFSLPTEVQFPTTVGRVSFHYRGRSRLEPSKYLVYRYRLVGHDQDWVQTSDRQAEYNGLTPGEYEFQVEAIDRDLNYSPTASVQLSVTEDPRIAALNEALRSEGSEGEFIGNSDALGEVRRQIQEVAWTDLTVLVLGETGTGKGLAARAIHELSERAHKPFVHVNCGALQDGLVGSELFGHERGAFTGAIARRLGKFELADGGTIFLDEIGDLPPESQTRLLHVLQDCIIERVGGTQGLSVDVRVIAATNRELAQAVRETAFRADLYYRLNVFPIRIPPLRERKEDIPLLTAYFVRRFAAHLNQPEPRIDEEAVTVLMEYDWPGNVRELEHTLQRAVISARGGSVRPAHFGMGTMHSGASPEDGSLEIVPLQEYERRYIARVLSRTGGVIHGQNGAAKLLDMKPTTLRSRLERLGLKKSDFRAK